MGGAVRRLALAAVPNARQARPGHTSRFPSQESRRGPSSRDAKCSSQEGLRSPCRAVGLRSAAYRLLTQEDLRSHACNNASSTSYG
eukprot:10363825-Prorocentrum_lima.AAC.1